MRRYCFDRLVFTMRLVAALLCALLLSPSTGRATTIHPLLLSRALRALAAPTVPAAWAGIWSFTEDFRDCTDSTIVPASLGGFDTLCVGAPYPRADTPQYVCSGTFTDTDFDITCTGTQSPGPNCSLATTSHRQGTRNGDLVNTTSTFTVVYTPTDCDGYPDVCYVTTGVMTYVGPAPADCATTPVRTSTWGSLKLRYR
jgi:hypothetical protein